MGEWSIKIPGTRPGMRHYSDQLKELSRAPSELLRTQTEIQLSECSNMEVFFFFKHLVLMWPRFSDSSHFRYGITVRMNSDLQSPLNKSNLLVRQYKNDHRGKHTAFKHSLTKTLLFIITPLPKWPHQITAITTNHSIIIISSNVFCHSIKKTRNHPAMGSHRPWRQIGVYGAMTWHERSEFGERGRPRLIYSTCLTISAWSRHTDHLL